MPIFPLWLHRWPAMRRIVLIALLAIIAVDALHAVLILSMESVPGNLDDILHILVTFPGVILFAPAGYCLWRWQVRRWCARPGLQGGKRSLIVATVLFVLAFEVWYFVSMETRGWLPHRYLFPTLIAGPCIAALCVLVLQAEKDTTSLTSRLLLLLSFAWCVAPTLVDLLHFSGNGNSDENWLWLTPALGTFLLSSFMWVFVPLKALELDFGAEGFHLIACSILGGMLGLIALWDLVAKRVHWTTALTTIAVGACLAGFAADWNHYIID